MKKLKGTTPLEKYVARWMNGKAEGYDSGLQGVYDDLMHGGCQSGFVSGLVYYTDTVKFYKKYRQEIVQLLTETLQNYGQNASPFDVFGKKWDVEDPLALNDLNQNLLAWFGFEETASRLCQEVGVE